MAHDLPSVPPPPAEPRPPPAPKAKPWTLTAKQRLLVNLGLPMLERIVAEVALRHRGLVAEEDLIGPGGIALHEAAITYREGPGTNFLHYAACHVRGRLADAIYGRGRTRLRVQVEQAMERVFSSFFQHLVLDVNMFSGTPEQLGEAMRQGGADAIASAYIGSLLEKREATAEEEMIELEGLRDRLAALEEAVKELEPHEEEVIKQVYWQGMQLKDIAKAGDMHENTAQNRRKAAIRKLRQRLLKRER